MDSTLSRLRSTFDRKTLTGIWPREPAGFPASPLDINLEIRGLGNVERVGSRESSRISVRFRI